MLARKFSIYLIICGVFFFSLFLIQSNIVFKNGVGNSASIISSIKNRPYTILLVPGHDTDTGGAKFNNIYERDLAVDVTDNIASILSKNKNYRIIVARNKQTWDPVLADYFVSNQQNILDFKNERQSSYKLLVDSGQEKLIDNPAPHTEASTDTAIQLYGINKWANENDVDLIIHIHFNNSTRKNVKLPGPRNGFDMYIPEKQSVNAATSRSIAENIYNELKKKVDPEAPGYYNSLFEDQSLIALGASNTLTKPSILIEYAYIYEKIIQTTDEKRKLLLEQMAEQTVVGIQNYLDSLN